MPVDGWGPVACVALAAAVSLATGATSRVGTATGALLGVAIAAGLGWRGFAMLATLLVVGTLASARKSRDRGAWQVACNALVAAAAALAAGVGAAWGGAAAAGALAAALSDTVSGEVGQRYGRGPRLLLLGPPAPPGTDGAMTVTGTVAGAASGLLVPLAGGFGWRGVLWIGAAGLLGNLFDSVLGATVQGRLGRRGNDWTNLFAAAFGALAAVLATMSH